MSHEPVKSFRAVSASSERTFGLVVGGLFALIAIWPAIWRGAPLRIWLLVPAVLIVVLAVVAPRILRPLNRGWFRLGLLLHRIVNPIVMGLLFFAAIVPMGFVLRKRGIDLLRLRLRPDVTSYWIERDPSSAASASLTKQF